jgi:hypothetical protein
MMIGTPPLNGSLPVSGGVARWSQPWANWITRAGQILGAASQSGTTADRPTTDLWIGRPYFDTTLNLPIVWNSGWIVPSSATGDVVGPASSTNNNVVFFDGTTGKLLKDSGLALSGSNTGDQTSIVGITGTLAEFNTALTGADFATGGGVITGTSSGTNTGDQTNITGNAATVTTNANLTGAIVTSSGNATTVNMSEITNSLSGDVALNNTAAYFTGPTVAQGVVGTWFVSGTVTVTDTAGIAGFEVRLWDGTTTIASGRVVLPAAFYSLTVSLSGVITSPAGNLRISVKDSSSTSGAIQFNASGNSKDSTITAIRIG